MSKPTKPRSPDLAAELAKHGPPMPYGYSPCSECGAKTRVGYIIGGETVPRCNLHKPQAVSLKPRGPGEHPFGPEQQPADFGPDDVEWIVNDLGELGVRVFGRCFFLYKGYSLEYVEDSGKPSMHDDGTPYLHRIVGKREFGETQLPMQWIQAGRREDRYTQELQFIEGLSDGAPEDGNWRPLPGLKDGRSTDV